MPLVDLASDVDYVAGIIQQSRQSDISQAVSDWRLNGRQITCCYDITGFLVLENKTET